LGEFGAGDEIGIDVAEDGEKLVFTALAGTKKS
jgi:hypothetical protein